MSQTGLIQKVVLDCPSMKLVLSTHKVTLTEGLKGHVNQCVEKLSQLDAYAIAAFVNLERDHKGIPDKKFTCTMKVTLPGQSLIAHDSENDLYAAVDLVTKKIQQQIRKRHSKFKAKNTRVAAAAKKALLSEVD